MNAPPVDASPLNAPLGKTLQKALITPGFAFVSAAAMRGELARHGQLDDWAAFAASWNDLGADTYMADGGRYRKRRFAVFSAAAGSPAIHREPHQPHYQSRDYNTLNGGIERWFPPLLPEIGTSASLQSVLAYCRGLFDAARPGASWHIELHQFRIEARAEMLGRPTPEGVHRDGVDYVLVLMIERHNIRSGETSIHAPDGRLLGSFTLTTPLDAALLDDHQVSHGVTAVEPIDAGREAHRDVLVITFRQMPPG